MSDRALRDPQPHHPIMNAATVSSLFSSRYTLRDSERHLDRHAELYRRKQNDMNVDIQNLLYCQCSSGRPSLASWQSRVIVCQSVPTFSRRPEMSLRRGVR